VLVATLPMLVFSAALLQHAYRVSAGLVETSALGAARRVAVSVDALIGRAEAVGYALAELPSSDITDFSEFEVAATRALSAAGLDSALAVIDRDGNVVAHTLRIPGEALGITDDLDSVHRVFETGQPQVSGLFIGPHTHQPQVAVQVPVLRDGHVRYAVAVMLSARLLGANAAADALPDRWFGLIADRTGRLIIDTADPVASIGQRVSPGLTSLVADRKEGFGSTRTRRKR